MSDSNSAEENPAAKAYAEAYRSHSATLRNWLVAYGVGGPALLFTNEKIRIGADPSVLSVIGLLFLAGVGTQITLSFLDKYSDWICYQNALDDSWSASRWTKSANWWVNCLAPAILFELAGMLCLAIATIWLFIVAIHGMSPAPPAHS